MDQKGNLFNPTPLPTELYNVTRFHENSFNGIGVTACTRLHIYFLKTECNLLNNLVLYKYLAGYRSYSQYKVEKKNLTIMGTG